MNEECIFSKALELESVSERERFLDSACGENPDQRQRIEQLLVEHANPDSFLDRGASPEAVATTTVGKESPDPAACDRIGDYRLLHVLGEGGMGTVYLAEQQQPVRRRVAVKIIKQGMNTKQFIARFEAERQALAMMDHPNIAKVLDAGCTEDGRPYFVMELVKGIPITEFCDENRLSTTERLELFVSVCQAVQHAHQKGIIHRDLKPSNVLVAMYDNQPVPKVIDFGVAKATHQPLTEHTLCTIPGQIVGTWEYMSPEQAILNQLDVDTRTDIYSLGVILYELLTGKTPLDLRSLRPEALEERLRRIREEEPSRPSLRVSSLGQAGAAMATYRRAESDTLAKSLKGDLDWIVMKAIEKDRSRRFETANGFAAEIARYLNDEPLSFRPPSTSQQVARFCRRHKSIAATATAITTALILGTGVAGWGYVRATRAQIETQQANEILRRTVEQLQDKLTGEALSLALVGDFPEAMRGIDEAKAAGADESLITALRGMAHLYSLADGSHDEAVRLFEESLALNPSSIAGATGVWLAYDQAGKYEKMSNARRVVESISDRSDLPDVEEFLLTQTNRHMSPIETLNKLDDLIDRNRFWAAAYAFRGRARVQVAKTRFGDPLALGQLADAINDFETAAQLAPNSLFVSSDFLLALVEASELANHFDETEMAQNWLKRATAIYEALPDTKYRAGYTFRARMMYWSAIGDKESLKETWELMRRSEATQLWVLAAQQFADGNLEGFRKLLDRTQDKSGIVDALRIIYLVDKEQGGIAALQQADRLARADNLRTDIDILVVYNLLLLGEPLRASEIAAELLNQNNLTNNPYFVRSLRYLANPSIETETTLKDQAGPFSDSQHHAYFTIGMYAFANGDRTKAEECFDHVLNCGYLDSYLYVWAYAYRERMRDDPTWPSWIEERSASSETEMLQ